MRLLMQFTLTLTLMMSVSTTIFAEKITHSAIMSPGCSKEDIKKIAGDALKDISDKKDWKDVQGFNITLNESKMTMSELAAKMNKEDCFKNKNQP